MRQGPLVNGLNIDAAHEQVFGLAAVVQVQKSLQHRSRSGRMIFNKKVCRAIQIRMLKMECYLVRAHGYLASPPHHLQFHHHKHSLPRQRYQAIRSPQVHPTLDPRYVTVW